MMNLNDKRVLIKGSSRGIGKETARMFLELGAIVAINGLSEKSVMTAIAELGGGNRLVPVPGNVNQAIQDLGGLDVLVNNAGVYYEASIETSDETLWNHTMDVNLKGIFFLQSNSFTCTEDNPR
jgi:NAD(P)-dependent dehydrogenase (short-subunit alcohol dehydrogenase family)